MGAARRLTRCSADSRECDDRNGDQAAQVTHPRNITGIGRAGTAVAVLACLALGIYWVRQFLAVDSCLDAGYVYDHGHPRCDTTAMTLPVTQPKRDVILELVGAAF